MDGYHYDAFWRAVNNGSAPNIKKYFVENGAYYTNAITVFPSISSNAYLSMISGLKTGHSGITYLGWFDRVNQEPIIYFTLKGQKHLDVDLLNLNALLDPDIDILHPPSTLFDYLEGHKTATVFSSFSANATVRRPKNPIPPLWSTFASQREEMLNKYAYDAIFKLYDQPVEEIPRFTLIGLYGFDAHGHHYGAMSPILDYTLEEFDQFIGRFFNLLKKKGIYKKTFVTIASDHGMHSTPRGKFNLKELIKEMGLKTYKGRPKREKYDVFVFSRGVASADLYLRGRGGWTERPSLMMLRNYPLNNGNTLDLIDKLNKRPEFRLIIARDGYHKAHVFSKKGHGLITYYTDGSKEHFSYKVVKGEDPLELRKSRAARMVGKNFYSAKRWSEKTYDHKYPNAVVSLSQVFADGRAGDIYVIAEPDWVFYRDKKGTHGSIYKDDMHIPILMHGPNVEKGAHGYIEIGDIFPIFMKWFGIVDGRLLRNKVPRNDKRYVQKVINKLEKIRDRLQLQKENPKKHQFTSPLVLDANVWLVEEQIKRIKDNAKVFLQ